MKPIEFRGKETMSYNKTEQPPAEGAESAAAFIKRKHPQDWDEIPQWHIDELNEFAVQQQPTAEGAEEILASLIESLGEPDNSIHDHSYEIRPLTVNGKCEWWMFHNGVGSGEPLAQWLNKFATQPQATAEGAEEILANHIDKESMDELSVNVWPDMLEAMQEFATLHAQRIADKMVSERLREELIAYEQWMFGQDNAKVTTSYIKEYIDEYLKARSHETK